ncbi:MAG: DNA topoisomerase IV subunit B, partial [Clostridia bacterium]|nr:DNA topoisomerase IV subunit B [Clostridia bacterium]
MYIGSTGERGLHHLVYEIVDNAIDEALAGYCTHIEVDILEGDIIRVTDNGRGIPVGIHPKMGIPTVEVVYTILHAGGKFGDGGYKVAGGLHGVGASVVNALSEYLEVVVRNGEHIYRQRYERGKTATKLDIIGDTTETGTIVTFKPDPTLFTDTTVYDYDILAKRLQEQAFLNAGIKITLSDLRGEVEKSETFHYEGGIKSYCEYILSGKKKDPIHEEVIYMSASNDKGSAEIALQFNTGYDTNIISFANTMHTIDGGTHENAFKTALTRVVNAYARKFKMLKDNDSNLRGEDVQEGMIAVVSVKLEDAQFESQTKAKLGNTWMGTMVSQMIGEQFMDYLENNPATAKIIINKTIASASAREAAQKARETSRKSSGLSKARMPEKLTDCISNDNTKTELYIVEGDSAGGS